MSSPFSWFRRRQKVLLAVFGVAIMISFTVGGIVTSYQQRNRGSGGGTDIVVSWKHGELSRNDLANVRYNHSVTIRFLDRVVQETMARKGWPKAPGVTRDQFGQIVPGIPRSSQDEDLVRTILMARKATDMGMVVTNEAIWDFLYLLSDDKLRRSEIGELLEATDDQVSQTRLFRQLRTELLAQNLERIIQNGFAALPPDQAWDYYNRSNRKITAEVFPIEVAEYTDKAKRTPTDADLKQLYEKAKNDYPQADPDSSIPGFKRRKKIAFEYLKVEYPRFLEQEAKAVPMEEVEKYYKEHKSDFKALDLPPAEDEKPEAKPTVTPGKDGASEGPDTEPNAGDTPSKEEKPSPGATDEASTEEKPKTLPKTEPPAKDEKPKAKPAVTPGKDDASEGPDTKPDTGDASSKEEKPGPEATDETSTEKPKTSPKTEPPVEKSDSKNEDSEPPKKTDTSAPDVDLVPPKNKPTDPGKPEPSKDAQVTGPKDTLFVSFNAQPTSENADAATEAQPEPKNVENVTEAKPAAEKPAELPSDGVAEKPKSKDDAASEASPPPAAKGKADEADAAVPDKEPPTSDGAAVEKEKPVKYQPLEDVEDGIRKTIAAPKAEEKRKKAIKDAEQELEIYFDERISWESMVKAGYDAVEPQPLDFEALAKRLGFTLGETPLADEIEITDQELGKALSFEGSQTVKNAYEGDIPLYKPDTIPPYDPNDMSLSGSDVHFLYWKIDEKDWKSDEGEDESVPEFDKIREEVAEAWQRIEALKLAKAEGERLAKEAKGDEPLHVSLKLDEEDVKVTGEFTWMTGGAMPMGMGASRISWVDHVESPGAGFMEAVFALKRGETGVAVNEPQSVVYVVRVVSESPDEDQRLKEFMERDSVLTFYFAHMATVQEVMADWHKDLEEEMQVKWH